MFFSCWQPMISCRQYPSFIFSPPAASIKDNASPFLVQPRPPRQLHGPHHGTPESFRHVEIHDQHDIGFLSTSRRQVNEELLRFIPRSLKPSVIPGRRPASNVSWHYFLESCSTCAELTSRESYLVWPRTRFRYYPFTTPGRRIDVDALQYRVLPLLT